MMNNIYISIIFIFMCFFGESIYSQKRNVEKVKLICCPKQKSNTECWKIFDSLILKSSISLRIIFQEKLQNNQTVYLSIEGSIIGRNFFAQNYQYVVRNQSNEKIDTGGGSYFSLPFIDKEGTDTYKKTINYRMLKTKFYIENNSNKRRFSDRKKITLFFIID